MTAMPAAAEELTLFAARYAELLDRTCEAIEGLDGAQLNWRPPAPEANSVYAITTHLMASAEWRVLGVVCGRDVGRDREAEWAATGEEASALSARSRDLVRRIDEALGGLPPAALDEQRELRAPGSPAGSGRSLTVREALLDGAAHVATHFGQLQVTRDLAMASGTGA